MKFENVGVYGFKEALHGMRNPKKSWDKSDSVFGVSSVEPAGMRFISKLDNKYALFGNIGPNDMKLATSLIRGGTEHRKFLRQISIIMDITAPNSWWVEWDTYRVGTTANSTSTMHTLNTDGISPDIFSFDDFTMREYGEYVDVILEGLEAAQENYNKTKDIRHFRAMKQLLPSAFNYTRTVSLNYEVALSMIHQRQNHRLSEWSKEFIPFLMTLPYMKEFAEAANPKTENVSAPAAKKETKPSSYQCMFAVANTLKNEVDIVKPDDVIPYLEETEEILKKNDGTITRKNFNELWKSVIDEMTKKAVKEIRDETFGKLAISVAAVVIGTKIAIIDEKYLTK